MLKLASTKPNGMTVVAIGSIPLIMTLGNSMLIPILPEMKSALKITQFQVSLTITVFSIAAAIMIPILGYLSDRISRKKLLFLHFFFMELVHSLLVLLQFGFLDPTYGLSSVEHFKDWEQQGQHLSQWH